MTETLTELTDAQMIELAKQGMICVHKGAAHFGNKKQKLTEKNPMYVCLKNCDGQIDGAEKNECERYAVLMRRYK